MNEPAERGRPAPETGSQARTLWVSLPGEVARRFRPHTDNLGKKILEAIQREVPEYAKPLEGGFGSVIIKAIEEAVIGSIDSIGGRPSTQDKWGAMFREVGRGVHKGGGSLDSLQASYRVGGQAAWRYIAAWGQRTGMPTPLLCVCAEAIFAVIEEISSYSVEGYTVAQTKAAGTLERRRRRLLELILATPPSSPQSIAATAKAAEWKLPEHVNAVALESPDDQHGDLQGLPLHADVLVDLESTQPCLVSANLERDLRLLQPALKGWLLAVGPRVPLADAATSLSWACRTLQLMRQRVIEPNPVVHSTDHLSTVWLMHDDFLLTELSRKVLGPLVGLTAKQQERLGETLMAWLESRGSTPEIAEVLKIHPQTVRYRLNQLTELFGDRLNDPAQRLDMQLALHAHRLRGTRPVDVAQG
ncbi:helix-turn-helix domain-containing protein [Amycolatopsis sp. NBC_01286]|uniref:PucR family transcriptional regulator n=1 Tax=Amycolatopsis sp. NBC_01286 TaxID=2903560 RepID=UPI002E119A18|nr:helix-turn-helix domain-containing protein [Amycolatopsis sp. NBC_01286]